jgi:DNA-binding transcriptional LysR family regulator
MCTLTRASQHLHLTQPTLTHNMQMLERQAGGRLFERSRLGVRSTPLGEQLAREGRAIARGLKDALEVSARHKLGLRGSLRIGTGPLIGAALLPTVVNALIERHPGLAVTLHSDRPHLLVDQLVDGQHDLVIGPSWRDRPPQGIERFLLSEDTLGVFCAPQHALAGRKRLAFGEAAGHAWISHIASSSFVQEVVDMLSDAGVEAARTEIAAVGEAMMLLRILSQGKHLAVLPRYPLRLLSAWFPLVELTLEAAPRRRDLHVWCRSSSLDSTDFIAVKDTIVSMARATQPIA